MKSISAVVNARLSSTRVPKKPVRPFAGSSLIEIALAKLDQMDFFDHRFLAVADEELKKIGRHYNNVEILHRKPEAVRKGVNPKIVTFAHYCDIPSDFIFVFNPCLPLISIETINQAVNYFQNNDFSSYTSVVKTGDWIFDVNGNLVTNKDPGNLTTNKDVQFYKAAHAFHIITKDRFVKEGLHWSFTIDDPHMIEISEDEYFDIDTEYEFKIAETIYINKSK
jgi:CMP-N-acetylneuraminic acid synthetase